MNDYDERVPPQDLNAERGALGGMLMSRDAIEEVTGIIDGSKFYVPNHESVFNAIVAVDGRGEPADAVTVAAELERRGELGRIGGRAYLHTLMESTPTAANAGWYADIVKAKARRRRMIRIGQRFQQMGYATEDEDFDEVVETAHAELDAETGEAEYDEGANVTALNELGDDLENPAPLGVLTGFKDLDELTDGLRPGDITVIAARSGMGKSTLDLDIHRHVSMRLGEHSLMFSLEMTRKVVMRRVLSAEARISTQHLRYGRMTNSDWDAYKHHHPLISAAPLHIVDQFGITLAQLKDRARKMARRYPIKLISVDYLQKLTTGKHRPENRNLEVAAISGELKNLSGELGIPIIAVAQLNRGPEHRSDKRPQLADLAESGALENDAGLVIMPYREDYYEKESPRAGEVDLIIPKNRHGATATITVAAQLHYSRFSDFDSARWSPSAAAR